MPGTLVHARRRRAALLALAIAALHGLGLAILLAVVLPRSHRFAASGGFGLGLGITAYTLGVRHAFDADHISAIDNTTRRLVQEGQRPLGVGFFFSLGHSTVVFVLAIAVAGGARGLAHALQGGGSGLRAIGSLIGPAVSGTFLLLIGVLNLVILANVLGTLKAVRRGECDEQELERHLGRRGFTNRFCSRATRAVRSSRQMYPLGLLFGLGFDTASEVSLLVLAAAGAAGGLPLYALVSLPLLFAAGMSLLDTIDGVLMNYAYGWAMSQPVRKLFYNVAVTGLSVVVALVIGTIELISLIVTRIGLTGGVWSLIAGIDLNVLGYLIVGVFLLTWLTALAVWRLGRMDERFSAHLQRS